MVKGLPITKGRSLLIVSIVLVLVIISAIFSYWYTTSRHKATVDYKCSIEIIPTDGFALLLPIPIYFDLSVSEIVNELRMTVGDGNHSLEVGPRGYTLNISGNSRIVLISEGKADRTRHMFDNLSMQLELTPHSTENWAHCWTKDNSSVRVKICVLSALMGEIRGERVINVDAQLSVGGWQRIKGTFQNNIT